MLHPILSGRPRMKNAFSADVFLRLKTRFRQMVKEWSYRWENGFLVPNHQMLSFIGLIAKKGNKIRYRAFNLDLATLLKMVRFRLLWRVRL